MKANKLNDADNLIVKKIPDCMAAVQGWIDKYAEEISEYEKIRDHLTENNITALDMIVAETEKRSRTHLRKLLGIDS